MTLEQLLQCDASKLASFTDKQLEEWFTPMFPITRPEQGRLADSKKAAGKKRVGKNDASMERATKIASQYGIDLNQFLKGL